MKKLFMLVCLVFLVSSCAETLKGGDFTYVIDKNNPLRVTFNSIIPDSKSYGDVSVTWDFGDGQQSKEPNPTHDYMSGGVYNVSLTVDSSKTFIESNVVSKELPLVVDIAGFDFTYKVDPNNSLAYLFEAKGEVANGIIEYQWNFGDGRRVTGSTVSHSFNELGIYPVELTATISNTNIQQVLKKEVEVNLSISELDFTYNSDPNNPLNLQFTAIGTPSRGELEYEWDFGFGATKKGKSVTHKYGTVGTFDVKLVATIQGTSTSFTIVKKINTSIFIQDADFTFGSDPVNPLEVYFNGNGHTTGREVSYEWDFGKGVIIASKNTSFRFNSFGDHTVTLKVYIYGTGVAQYVTKKVTIAPPEIIGLDIIATPSEQNPLEIFFEAKGSTSFGEIEYEWDFGRGKTATGKSALVKFENFGEYMVTLKVSVSGTFVSDDFSKKIRIPTPVIGDLDFIFEPDLKRPREVFFQATGTTTFGELEYEWDFGRGKYEQGRTALYTFSDYDKYNVYLTAKVTGTKVSKTISKLLDLSEDENVNFTCFTAESENNAELQTSCSPILDAKLNLEPGLIYKWEIYDTKGYHTYDSKIIRHTFPVSGKYKIILTVDGPIKEPKVRKQDIYVLAKPKIEIHADKTKTSLVNGVYKSYYHVYIRNTWTPYDKNTIDVFVRCRGACNADYENPIGDLVHIRSDWGGGVVDITVEYRIKGGEGHGSLLSTFTEARSW